MYNIAFISKATSAQRLFQDVLTRSTLFALLQKAHELSKDKINIVTWKLILHTFLFPREILVKLLIFSSYTDQTPLKYAKQEI